MLIITVLAFFLFNYFPALTFSTDQKLENLDLFYQDTRPGAYNYWSNWQTFLKGTVIPFIFVGIISFEFFCFQKENDSTPKKTLLRILLAVIFLFFFFNLFSNFIYKGLEMTSGWSMIEWPVDIAFISVVISLLAVITMLVNSGVTFLPPSKYATSSLHEESYEEILTHISQVVREKQLYKQPDFNLQHLSNELNSNASHVSQVINHGLGMRFNDYINQFRVEEAKRQLLSPENRHLTIEAISELCGFQSKSTFFRVFKKTTGFTPKQFIKGQ